MPACMQVWKAPRCVRAEGSAVKDSRPGPVTDEAVEEPRLEKGVQKRAVVVQDLPVFAVCVLFRLVDAAKE